MIAQQRKGLLERAARTQQLIAIERVLDRETELAAAPHSIHHLLGEMTEAQNHSLSALFPQQFELMKDERSTGNIEKRLWQVLRQRMHPGSQPTGQYGNGQHAQERTTLVP